MTLTLIGMALQLVDAGLICLDNDVWASDGFKSSWHVFPYHTDRNGSVILPACALHIQFAVDDFLCQ